MTRDEGKKRKRSTRQGQERKKKYEAGPHANERKKNYEAAQRMTDFGEKKRRKKYEAGQKKSVFFETKNRKKKLSEANGRCNNGAGLAGRRFLTRKLATCSRYTVKTNTKRTRHALGSSTIIFIKEQQHSTDHAARSCSYIG